MHIKVVDIVGAYFYKLTSPIVHDDDIQCTPVMLLTPAIVHLFAADFYECSPIVLEFPLERTRYHSSKPHFHFNPHTYGQVGYLIWSGSLIFAQH